MDANKIKIAIPKDVNNIISLFESEGHRIYAIGGAIRDSLLGRDVNDWDLCTNATPCEMIEVCNKFNYKYVPTGLQHGTITIMLNGEGYETTTFRQDGEYTNGRSPDSVEFTDSLKLDLSRRDFTINAMAYNNSEGLIDYFGGIEDLNNKIIRCVGNPQERMSDDGLRLLRAIRFSCQLDFDIEYDTWLAISKLAKNINKISKERINSELCKILISEYPKGGLLYLHFTSLMKEILPEVDDCIGFNQHNIHHDKDIFQHILSVVESTPPTLELRLSALLHDIGKPRCFTLDDNNIGHFYEHAKISADMSRKILTRLKFDNKTINKVCILVYEHMTPTDLNDKSIKKLIQRVGEDNICDLVHLMISDRLGMAENYRWYLDVAELQDKANRIIEEKQPLSVKDLAINGKDLMALGIKQGRTIGVVLDTLLELVLEYPKQNDRGNLIALVKNRVEEKYD